MISIDTVHQRVLAIANKEQRGYITPQEYNLLANQAQMQIFESYFYTKDRREKIEANKVGNELRKQDKLEKKVKRDPKIISKEGNVIKVNWGQV